MADKVASLYAELDLRDNMTRGLKDAEKAVKPLHEKIKSLGASVTQLGVDMLKMSAPVIAGFGFAVNAAMGFDTAMTNTAAVMGLTRDQTAALGDQLLQIGMDSQAGPQAVAEAYYDIAGGVADASTHMAILNQAIATSEAGAAELGGTTKALISVMNSYEFAADDAAYASDVLTRTVGMGVGTMDELASAMPQVAGLAHSLGISFEDLGAMMAFLSTKGNTFSESATQISAMMTAMIKPNQQMTEALLGLGFATGQAAIDALGLQGAYQALIDAGHGDQMAALTGSVEALRGVTALTVPDAQALTDALAPLGPAAEDAYRGLSSVTGAITDLSALPSVEDYFAGAARGIKESGAVGFMQEFSDGLDGVTESTREIQNASAQAQWNDIKTDLEGLAIVTGQALLPAFAGVLEQVKPFVTEIINFAKNNPEAVQGMAMLALGAAAFGVVMMPLGWIVGGFGTAVRLATGAAWLLNGALTFMSANPVVAIIGAIAGMVAILGSGEGGLAGGLSRAATAARQLVLIGIYFITDALTELSNSPLFVAIRGAFETAFNAIKGIVEGVVNAITGFLGEIGRSIDSVLRGLGLIKAEQNTVLNTANQILSAGNLINLQQGLGNTQPVYGGLGGIGATIGNAVMQLQGKADGGPVMAGIPYKVGERGMEWFVPSTNGTIVNQRQASGGGMGGVTIGTLVLNGVNDPQKLFDEIQKVARQRSM